MSTSRVLIIDVDGIPGPQGSKSFRGFTKKGKPILTESSKKVKPWREAVADAAMKARTEAGWLVPTDAPVMLNVTFYLPRPKSAPKTIRIRPTKYPDASKLLRATEDALTTARVWRDDAQVYDAYVRKRYAIGPELPRIYRGETFDRPTPGAIISITELPYTDPPSMWLEL